MLQRAVLAEGKARVEGAAGAEARNELGDLAARTWERVAATDLEPRARRPGHRGGANLIVTGDQLVRAAGLIAVVRVLTPAEFVTVLSRLETR